MFELDSFFESDMVKKEFAKKDNFPTVLERWSKYTEGLETNDQKTLSILLENQKLIDEMNSINEFTRISIDLVAGMYRRLLQMNLCYVMPMLGPTQLHHELFKALTRRMKPLWKFEAQQDGSAAGLKKAEEIALQSLKDKLFQDIFSEIYSDLSNNCSVIRNDHVDYWPKAIEDFFEFINSIKRPAPEWMITNDDIGEVIAQDKMIYFADGLPCAYKVGYFKTKDYEIPVIVNPELKQNEILFGRKEAYIHAGYVPLSASPVVLEPTTFQPKRQFLIRYDKKLLDSKCLYKLTFNKQITVVK